MKVSVERVRSSFFPNLVRKFDLLDIVYIVFFMCSIISKSVFLQFQNQLSFFPLFSKINIYMLVATTSFGLIVTSFMIVFYTRNKILFLLINIFLSVFLFADAMYFRYYNTIITVPVIYHVQFLNSIGGSAVSLLRKSDILYFLDIPLFIVFTFIFWKRAGSRIPVLKRIMIALLITLLAFGGFKLAFSKNDTSKYDNNYIVKNLGIGYFHYFDTMRFIKENYLRNKKLTSAEENDIKTFFDEKKKRSDSSSKNFAGDAKGKNLIIIQVEALQDFVIGKEINGKEITPNLNKLAKESLYFNNIYVQVAGGNTADAEFMTNTSLYPAKEGAAYFRFATNKYNSLPKVLKETGYDSYVFHAYTPSFWNRTEMYKAIGFDKFINSTHYVMDEYIGWGGWALSDDSFFRQSMEKVDVKKPFYSFFITLSSHHPYSYFDDKQTFDVGQYDKTYLGNYLKAQNYADSAIGRYIDKLKETGVYENSLIVIYGDHTGLPKAQAGEDLLKFLGKTDSKLEWAKLQKVPLFIHYSGMEGKVIDKTGGQVDFYPLVANIMGFDNYYALGKDLLNCDKGYAVLRNGSVITDDFFYFSDEDKVYDIKTGSALDREALDKEIKLYQKDLDISDLMLEKDALRKLK